MFKDLVVYCDMDGVLADFYKADPRAEKFSTEKGFFNKLEPIMENVLGIKCLIESGAKVYILSATPHKRADKDKAKWLSRVLPEIPKQNRIFVRIGENKANYIKEKGLLFDDYGKNIREWTNQGMPALKVTKDCSIYKMLAYLPKEVR